jgi:hypothetical protein
MHCCCEQGHIASYTHTIHPALRNLCYSDLSLVETGERLAFVAWKILAEVSFESRLACRRITVLDTEHPGATSTGVHGYSLGRRDWAQNARRVVGHRFQYEPNA